MRSPNPFPIEVLGPLRLRRGRVVVPVPGGRQRLLLERLLASVNEVVPADALVEAAWGADTPARPHEALQVAISRVRRTLDGLAGVTLEHRGGGYVLLAETSALDVLWVAEQIGKGTDLDVPTARCFQDFSDAPFVAAARARWDDRLRRRTPRPAVSRPTVRTRPALRAGDVRRPGLAGRVLGAPPGGVVSIVAPAGSGKSTLLAQVAAGSRTAWLAVDPRHDTAERFKELLLDALAAPEVGVAVTERLADVDVGAPLFCELLVDELTELDSPLLLVVDDAHLLTDAQVTTFLRMLARRLPTTVRLVAAGRRSPPLGLAHLRLQRRLVELGPDDLAFDQDDVRALLAAESLPDDPATAERLRHATGGWAAALVLHAFTAQGAAGHGFEGGSDDVVDFIRHEVLADMDPELVRYLCALAVVGRFDADLATRVWPDADPAWLIHEIEGRGLFVHRGVDGDMWFHDLFGAALLHEAPARLGREIVEVHRRAAAAREQAGDLDSAIEHYSAIDDTAAMWAVISSGSSAGGSGSFLTEGYLATLTTTGDMQRIEPWLEQILRDPPDDRRFFVTYTVLLALQGDAVRTRRSLDIAEEGVDWSDPPEEYPLLGLAAAAVLVAEGRLHLAQQRIESCLDVLGRVELLDKHPGLLATRLQCSILVHRGLLDEAVAIGSDALERHHLPGAERVQRALTGLLAFAEARRGDNRSAQQWLDRGYAFRPGALDATTLGAVGPAGHGRDVWPNTVAMFREVSAQAMLLDRAGDPGAARTLLRRFLRTSRTGLATFAAADLYLLLCTAEAQLGEIDDATENLSVGHRLMTGADGAVTTTLIAEEARMAVQGETPQIARGVGALDLSDREQAVLRMLQGTLTLREIARELYVSVNTVKTHTQSVYRKLGVSSRAEAVQAVRSSGP